MNELVRTAKALADPTRVRIVSALRERELCVCELCDSLQVTQSTLSTQLQVIREAGLVSARKQGKWMYYAIHPESRGPIEALFKLFEPSLNRDPALRADERGLRRRLALRDDGACCVGFTVPSRKSGTKRR